MQLGSPFQALNQGKGTPMFPFLETVRDRLPSRRDPQSYDYQESPAPLSRPDCLTRESVLRGWPTTSPSSRRTDSVIVISGLLTTHCFTPNNRPFYVTCTELRSYTGPTDHSRTHANCSCRTIFDGPSVGDDGIRLGSRQPTECNETVRPQYTHAEGMGCCRPDTSEPDGPLPR
jgi:hypothetical protein